MRKRILLSALLGVVAAPLVAIHVIPDVETVPIDRVVMNLERMVTEDPGSIEIRVNLARLHSMAYASKAAEVPTFRTGFGKAPGFSAGQPYFGFQLPHLQPAVKPAPDGSTAAKAKAHLTKAIENYRAVLAQVPNHALAAIGLGWTLKESGDKASAITALRRAVELGWIHDSPSGTPMEAARSPTEEAALYLIPLLDPVKDAAELSILSGRLRDLRGRGRFITPIAVPSRVGVSSDEMIASDRLVAFDLDGSGILRKWTWLSQDAAWLVHDHRGTGQIASALQLFGNVTFWGFWENGYHALRAMDDDGDGEIRGRERIGLALWHDRNS